jgi:hypothetical protein
MLPFVRALRAVLAVVVAAGASALALGLTASSAGAAYKGCDTAISSSTLVPGEHATVEGDDDCFEHQSPVDVGIDPPGTTLGGVTSSPTGAVSANVTIPPGSSLGPHTITMSGAGPAGTAVTYSIPVTIVASVSRSSTSSGALAFTGSDEGILIAIAAALMAIGLGVTTATRRRRRARAIG